MSDQNRNEIKRGRKFDQVVDGAREIFMRDGIDGASVDDITRAAGVSKATLYSYFPDKGAMFMEVCKGECTRRAEAALDILDMNGPPRQVLTQVAIHIVDYMSSDFGQESYRINTAESVRFPEMGREFHQTLEQAVIHPMIAYFNVAIERGDLQIDDLELAAHQLMELCQARYFERLIHQVDAVTPQHEKDRTINGAVDMFMARYSTNSE